MTTGKSAIKGQKANHPSPEYQSKIIEGGNGRKLTTKQEGEKSRHRQVK